MTGAYDKYKGISGLNIKQRIKAFRAAALETIEEGRSIDEMKDAAKGFEEEEQYEAAQGINEAIKDFESKVSL